MKKKKILIGILILLISVCFGKATYNVYASDVCIAGNYYDKNAIVIVSQPISSYYTAGQKVVTSVKAEGDNLSYQWQFSFDGSNWQNWGGTGYNTSETWYDYPAEFIPPPAQRAPNIVLNGGKLDLPSALKTLLGFIF